MPMYRELSARAKVFSNLSRTRRLATLVAVALLSAGALAGQTGSVSGVPMPAVTPVELRIDLRNLPQVNNNLPTGPRPQLDEFPEPPRRKPTGAVAQAAINTPLAAMPSPAQNFAGLSFNTSVTGGQAGAGWPPDTNGDVGPNHYIEAVNEAIGIYSKTGTLITAFTENSLFSGSGAGSCDGNSYGDTVALHDQLADRWFLTWFAFPVNGSGNPVSPFYECIAVSKSSDPVAGGWWLYGLRMDPGGTGLPPVGTLNDYPKFGIWNDGCIYMSSNEFTMPSGNFA